MALLSVDNLSVSFVTRNGTNKAVDNVSFSVEERQITAIIGESGSGKSVSCYAILGLVPSPPGRIDGGTAHFQGQDLLALSEAELRAIRGRDIAMIFQDPYASLNPRMTVYDTLAEPLLLHGLVRKADLDQAIRELMDNVGLARAFVRKYPHEFSGGQRQRIAIGRALATRPEFIVADEPVSALDVTIQAQILDLLADLTKEYGLTMLFISHDLAVIRQIADRIAVMYHGKLVEEGSTAQVFETPREDYTRSLLAAIPGTNAA